MSTTGIQYHTHRKLDHCLSGILAMKSSRSSDLRWGAMGGSSRGGSAGGGTFTAVELDICSWTPIRVKEN